jgi:hypothetical protein
MKPKAIFTRYSDVIKKWLLTISLLLAFNGCIVYQTVSYEVKLDTPGTGTATITAYDMRTDAKSKKDLEQDKKNLFQYMLKSGQFISDQKESGKNITGRKLFIEDDKLIGQGTFKFDDVSAVEGIKYEDGFHYLTLGVDDSVVSTNGEIIRSKDYKRIMWDSTFSELKFTMFSNDLRKSPYKSLAPYFDNKNN